MTEDRVMWDGSRPFQERVRQLRDAWVRDGRTGTSLVTGTAFFAVYCWSLNYKICDPTGQAYDGELAEFVAAAHELNGGSVGWNAMLKSRETCSTCHDRYRLENLGICTACMQYTCYFCGDHRGCAGQLL